MQGQEITVDFLNSMDSNIYSQIIASSHGDLDNDKVDECQASRNEGWDVISILAQYAACDGADNEANTECGADQAESLGAILGVGYI